MHWLRVHNNCMTFLLQMPDQAYILKKLFARELSFPEERLRRAVSYGGNPERLQRVLQKLMRGEPINVAVVGGSVTGTRSCADACTIP